MPVLIVGIQRAFTVPPALAEKGNCYVRAVPHDPPDPPEEPELDVLLLRCSRTDAQMFLQHRWATLILSASVERGNFTIRKSSARGLIGISEP